jgi:hypothetical protein
LQLFVYGYAIMKAVEMDRPMTRWNDDRLDDLSQRMENGFNATRQEIGELRADMRHLNERFDRLYYLVLVTIVGCFGSLLANGVFG